MKPVGLLMRGVLLALLVLLQACATVTQPDRRDPLESFNRSMFEFNEGLDKILLKPVATAYQAVMPSPVRSAVGNFFANLEDVWSAVNNGLQGRGDAMGNSIARVLVNSTIGIFGLADVATDLKIEKRKANFGMTLGTWGAPPGPYLVIPLLGPSTLREVVALPIDMRGDLTSYVRDEGTRTGLGAISLVETRAQYLNAGNVMDEAGFDKYLFFRNAYLQRQRYRQYDGDPPDEDPEP